MLNQTCKNIMDDYTLNTQKWLKETYKNKNNYPIDSLVANGKPGQDTIDALIAALQIELGLTNPNGVFGPATTAAIKALGTIKCDENAKPSNIIMIIQGACYCKGYDAGKGLLSGIHTMNDSGSAIKLMKIDMGLSNNNGDVTFPIWKVLLSMKQFKVLNDYGGLSLIAEIQRNLNRNYFDYIGEYVACDGICQRDTITGIIFAIQKEEKLPISTATGVFGPATSANWITPKLGDNNAFTKILNWCLYINGYTSIQKFPTEFDSSYTLNSIKRFEAFMALPITGIANASLMKYLLLSCGDLYRDVNGCDCATPLTQSRINVLKGYGYEYVGRYITHGIINGMDKCLTVGEINLLLENKMHIFPIYQTWADDLSYFNSTQGRVDAKAAIETAKSFHFPQGTVIYFAVDVDIMEGDLYNSVVPHFKAISEVLRSDGNFRAGIYSARNTCTIVSNCGYTTYSFVSGMSTGFSGNLGFPMPSNWSFNQIVTVSVGEFEVDNNAVSGLDSGITTVGSGSSVILDANTTLFEQIHEVYNCAYDYKKDRNTANLLTLQSFRYQKYNSSLWDFTAGTMDLEFYEMAKKALNYKVPLDLYDPDTGYCIGSIHLCAVMNTLLYETAEEDTIYNDFAGWAGDLVTYAENIKGNTDDECYQNALELMGSYDAQNTNFSYQDILADIDAVNIIYNLKKSTTSVISGVLINYYYGPDKEYKYRFTSFMKKISMDYNILQEKVDFYTSDDPIISIIRNKISRASQMQLKAAGRAFINFIKQKVITEI